MMDESSRPGESPYAPLDPRVVAWLARTERAGSVDMTRRRNPAGVPFTRRLRHTWWGFREGSALYFYNHIVNRLPSHKLRLALYRRIFDEIGPQSSILLGLKIFHPGRVIIGRNSVINAGCVLDSRAGIYIGNNVSISNFVQIWSGGHDINSPNFASYGGLTVIEDYVWLASSAIIVGGSQGKVLTLGEGCVVTAGSVVVRDVAPYTVVAGNPARKIAMRSRDLDYQLNYFPLFR